MLKPGSGEAGQGMHVQSRHHEVHCVISVNLSTKVCLSSRSAVLPLPQTLLPSACRAAGLSDWLFYWSSHPTKRYSGTAILLHPACAPLRATTKLGNAWEPVFCAFEAATPAAPQQIGQHAYEQFAGIVTAQCPFLFFGWGGREPPSRGRSP